MTANQLTSTMPLCGAKRSSVDPSPKMPLDAAKLSTVDPSPKKRRCESPTIKIEDSSSSIIGLEEDKRQRLDAILVTPPASPTDFIAAAFRANGCDAGIQLSTSSHLFHNPTEDEIAAYSQDVIKAVRERDIPQLREFLKAGRSLQCCNRFGESLMHMACRRGFNDVVHFLVLEANCTLYVRDDYGRTAMHDAAWSPLPNFDLMQFLIEQTPELLLQSDVRGHTPFSYVRKEHWEEWIAFLQKFRGKLCLPLSNKPLTTVA
jgi:hypothetical protein